MKKILISLLIALSSTALSSTPAFATDIIVNCGATIDVDSKELTGPRSFTISGSRISAVDNVASNAANVIDLSTYTCLPGLIDMHVHLTSQSSPRSYIERFTLNKTDYAFRAAHYAKITLNAGFTTVRNLGDEGLVTVSLRKAIDQGIAQVREFSRPGSLSRPPAATLIRPTVIAPI